MSDRWDWALAALIALALAGIVWFTTISASTPMRVPSGLSSVEDVR